MLEYHHAYQFHRPHYDHWIRYQNTFEPMYSNRPELSRISTTSASATSASATSASATSASATRHPHDRSVAYRSYPMHHHPHHYNDRYYERYRVHPQDVNHHNPHYSHIHGRTSTTTNANYGRFEEQYHHDRNTSSLMGGCKCQKIGCLKRYCDCFKAGLKCGSQCSCVGCQNFG